MAVRIQLRGGTAAEWTSENPVLGQREFAIETDTKKFKIGDGATVWNSLAYATQGEKGDPGATGDAGPGLEFNWSGTQLGVRVEGESTYTYVDLKGIKGDPGDPGIDGDDGRGITSITRTSGTGAAGTTDTYTISYTDSTASTFTVYNGANGGGATTVTYTGTLLKDDWTGSSAPYSQTIAVTGMASTDNAVTDATLTGTYATDQAILTNFAQVYRMVSGTNQVTAYANAIPTVDIPLQFKIVR